MERTPPIYPISYLKNTPPDITKVPIKYAFMVMGTSVHLILVVAWRTPSTAVTAAVSLIIDKSDKVDREKGKIGEKNNAMDSCQKGR